MKTNNTLISFKTLLTCIAFIGFVIINNPSSAQKFGAGITLKNGVSGAGLGSTLSPQLSLRAKNHEILIGLNVQKKHMNVAGIKAGYNFILNPGDAHEVFLFYDFASFNNAYLSKNTIKQESFMHRENTTYFQTARINVIEQHIGFGVNFFKTGPVSFFGAIGGGFYKTLGMPPVNQFKNRDIVDVSVMLNVGVTVKIIQNK